MPDVQVKLLKCQQCSAALQPRAGQSLFRCAFCGSSYLVEGLGNAPDAAPLRWLPFGITPQAAGAARDRWLASGFLRPGDLATVATVSEPAAVMVPVYLGRARAHSNWSAEVVRARLKKIKEVLPPHVEIKTGDGVRMRADSHLIAGAHDAEYENVFVLASRGLSESAFKAIANFDWTRLAAMPAAADATLEEPNIARDEALRRVRHKIEDAERRACENMIPGTGGRVVDLRTNTVIQDLKVELVYVPVYVCAYQYHAKPYRTLVNGVSAACDGDAPLSIARTALAIVSVVALPALAWFIWRRRR